MPPSGSVVDRVGRGKSFEQGAVKMNVEQLMTRQVRTCQVTDSLNEVAQSMWEGDLGCVPVLGDGSQAARAC